MKTVASYCATFLKPEMLHIYRQVSSLQDYHTFIVAKDILNQERFPMPEGSLETAPARQSNFLKRFWLKYLKHEPPIVYRGEYGALERLLHRRHADLMHVYFGHTGVHLLPFIERWPQPTIVSFHGMDVQPRAHQPDYLPRLQTLLQKLPLVLARSESLKERLIDLGCPESKIRINRTGIPLDAFPWKERTPPADGAWHLVQACRLIAKKGLDTTLHTFAALQKKYPNARLTFAGEGPDLEKTQSLAQDLGLQDHITYAGFLSGPELCQLYHHAHLFIHPSRITEDQNQEGVPNSMLEAMATGLPVLSTLHGGIPEALTNGKSGHLVKENDHQALSAKLLDLTDTPERWKAMSKHAHQEVSEKFAHAEQIRKLEGFYDEALEL